MTSILVGQGFGHQIGQVNHLGSVLAQQIAEGVMLLTGDLQQLDALGLEALEIIRRSAGLECAAAQHVRARGLHGLGDRDDLLFGFDRARARDHAEVSAANLDVAHLHDHVVGMELAVAALEGLCHALDGVDDAQTLDQVHVDARRVADQAQHGLVLALGDVHAKALIFEPVDKLLALVLFCATLEYDDHNNFLLIDREISPQRKNAAQV